MFTHLNLFLQYQGFHSSLNSLKPNFQKRRMSDCYNQYFNRFNLLLFKHLWILTKMGERLYCASLPCKKSLHIRVQIFYKKLLSTGRMFLSRSGITHMFLRTLWLQALYKCVITEQITVKESRHTQARVYKRASCYYLSLQRPVHCWEKKKIADGRQEQRQTKRNGKLRLKSRHVCLRARAVVRLCFWIGWRRGRKKDVHKRGAPCWWFRPPETFSFSVDPNLILPSTSPPVPFHIFTVRAWTNEHTQKTPRYEHAGEAAWKLRSSSERKTFTSDISHKEINRQIKINTIKFSEWQQHNRKGR